MELIDRAQRQKLEAQLGHSFADPARLVVALTHRSFANENGGREHNERLEFLGDAVIGAAAATQLVRAHPEAREGELTRRRADLVCESALAAVARTLGIGDLLLLGKGELHTGGREKPRILAGVVEAIVGAVELDAGAEASLRVAATLLALVPPPAEPGARDPKSRLQERAQAKGLSVVYEIESTSGPEHARTFFVVARVGDVEARGEGRSRSDAEHEAARAVLEGLGD